jgi:hypothetical protein
MIGNFGRYDELILFEFRPTYNVYYSIGNNLLKSLSSGEKTSKKAAKQTCSGRPHAMTLYVSLLREMQTQLAYLVDKIYCNSL